MKTAAFLQSSLLAISALALCSCASVSVRNVDSASGRPLQRPTSFVVQPFSTAGAEVRENSMRKNRGQLAGEAQQLLADYLVAELSKNIAPARRGQSRGRASNNVWVVTGDITRISEGNRLLRMGIGLGAGGTKMETRVAVHQASATQRPFLRFATSGGSGAMPGAATNPIPFSSAPSALLNSTQGMTDDAARTARQITAAIAEYMAQRGWPTAARVAPPKRSR